MTTMNAHHQQDTTITSLTDTIYEEAGKETEKEVKRLRPLPNVPKGLLFSVDPPAEETPSASSPPPSRPRPLREKVVDSRIIPPIIPPEHEKRTLVLMFDGTGDQFDGDNSNIVQLCSLLKKEDRSKQMIYYQAGIGTYASPAWASPLMSRFSLACDMMFAKNLPGHVMGMLYYSWCVKNGY